MLFAQFGRVNLTAAVSGHLEGVSPKCYRIATIFKKIAANYFVHRPERLNGALAQSNMQSAAAAHTKLMALTGRCLRIL
jgi:hypothetical protein